MKPPEQILGVEVKRVLDTWYVEDDFGARTYCKVETKDGREVTLLRKSEEWIPTIVTGANV